MGTNSLGLADVGHAHFGQANVFDAAVLLGFLKKFQRPLEGYGRVDAVKLVEVDLLDFEALEAAVEGDFEVLGAGIDGPLARAGAEQAALGGDDDAGGIRVQGFGNQLFRHVGAVAVGGVDEVDAELYGPTQHPDGLVVVGGRAPDAFAGDAHGAVAEAVDGEVAADGEGGRGTWGRWCWA